MHGLEELKEQVVFELCHLICGVVKIHRALHLGNLVDESCELFVLVWGGQLVEDKVDNWLTHISSVALRSMALEVRRHLAELLKHISAVSQHEQKTLQLFWRFATEL